MSGQSRRRLKRSREEGNGICRECSALCCRDLTLLITKPRTRTEVEDLKWQLRMDTVQVFIRRHRWHLLFQGRCTYLSRNNLCKIYDRRPQRCRRHDPSECERTGVYYETLISTPEELDRYLNGSVKR